MHGNWPLSGGRGEVFVSINIAGEWRIGKFEMEGKWRKDWRKKCVEILEIGKILWSLLRACRLFSPGKWMFIIQFIESSR